MDLFGFKAKRRNEYIQSHRGHVNNVATLEYKGDTFVVYVDENDLLRTACWGLSVSYMNYKLDTRKLKPLIGVYNMHIRQWLDCVSQLTMFHIYLNTFDWPEKYGVAVLREGIVVEVIGILDDLDKLVVKTTNGRLEMVSPGEITRYETKEVLHKHLMHLLDRSHRWGKNKDALRRDPLGLFHRRGINNAKYYILATNTKTLDELMVVLTEDLKQND